MNLIGWNGNVVRGGELDEVVAYKSEWVKRIEQVREVSELIWMGW